MRLRTALAVGALATAAALPAAVAPAPAAALQARPAPAAREAGTLPVLRALAPAPASVPRAPAPLPREAAPGPAPAPGPVPFADTRLPRCGAASVKDFPIDTRIHAGPSVHHPGGGFERWSVELTNTTGATCRNIHPVLVFAARDRGLTPARLMLEFQQGTGGGAGAVPRWLPADLETTGEDEIVAVLDRDGAEGFTVPARASVTVPVRLALTADTPPNQVTVNAAVVQRRGDDGEWLGQSGDHRFAVLDDNGYGATVTRDELATTGSGSLLRLAAALGAVLLGGGALALVSRRLRSPGR
ncbi:hypothetical protein [Streptomyces sp. NPDC001889]